MAQARSMSWILLALMTVAAVASIRALPGMALYGLGAVMLYLLPALLFFLPAALVTTELGTTWSGGVYGWCRQAFGEPFGIFASWFGWIQVCTLLPIILAFAADSLAFVINPALAGNGIYTGIVIIGLYWLVTLVALRGVKQLARLSSLFMLAGTLFPALVLVVLGAIWLAQGHPSQAPLTWSALLPDIFGPGSQTLSGHAKTHPGVWHLFTGAIAGIVLILNNFLAYSGIEMNALYASSLPNPQRDMPRAIGLAIGLILLIFIPPTLAIAVVVPADATSLTAGVMQAYSQFFHAFGWDAAIDVMALLLVFGALGGVLIWSAGPAEEMLFVGKAGLLPRWWQVTNPAGMPRHVLLAQAGMVTALASLYFFIPDVSAAFWMLSTLSAQIYLVLYVMMFVAAIRLRRLQPDLPRGYRAPCLHALSVIGMLSSLAAFAIGFVPPRAESMPLSGLAYFGLLAGGLVLAALPPFLFYRWRRPEWEEITPAEAEAYSAPLTRPTPPHPSTS